MPPSARQTTHSPPVGYVKFRIPYAAIDVFADNRRSSVTFRNGSDLDDGERSLLRRDAARSQARYDRWLEDLRTATASAMPSFKPCDERPSRHERVILASPLFRISIIAENWCFAVKLSTDPASRNRGAQVSLFPRFCRNLRDILLKSDAAGSILVKRSQTSFIKLSELSDADLDAMSSAARIRLEVGKETVKGYNEPERPGRRRKAAMAETGDGGGKETAEP